MRAHFLLFLLLLILLPVQAGKHFWPDWSFVHGIRVDYLSPTLFLTDVFALLVFALWFLKNPKGLKIIGKNKVVSISLFVFLLVSSLLAARPQPAFYKLLKLIELGLFGLYVSQNIVSRRRFILAVVFLSLGMTWSCLLALVQFWFQSSLSSVYFSFPLVYSFLQLLGERTFDIATPGIAKARWGSQLVFRPYATFPHPNVLAGSIILVSLLVLTNLPLLIKGKKRQTWLYYLLPMGLFLITLLITFSRSAWMICFLTTGYWFLIKRGEETKRFFKKRRRFGLFLAVLGLLVAHSVWRVVFPWLQALKTDDSLSVFRRIELAKAALRMVWASPVWGIGLGNFIPRLFDFSFNREVVYWLQPVHNIFLLIAAETGLIGLGVFLWFLIKTIKRLLGQQGTISDSLLMSLVAALLLGFFDHYFFTLQSAQLLFVFLLGLSWARIKKGGRDFC